MNADTVKEQWPQIRELARLWWSVLTNDDLDKIDGRLDRLVSQLQDKYGFTKDQAIRDIEDRLAELQRLQAVRH